MSGRWKEIAKPGAAPHDPGVYAIIQEGRVVYVGSSASLRTRLYHHGRDPRFQGARFKVRPCAKYGEWLMVELRLIYRLAPRWNARPPALHPSLRA